MLAYGSSLSGSFIYEDGILPARTDLIRGAVRWSHDLTALVAGVGDPFPARVVNLAWHLLNGCLLWVLARRVVTARAALCAAGLFLLHPLQTESVAYLASRTELIAATWILLACWAASRERLWLAAGCAALAITGKEMAVMAWLLVPLWAWWAPGRPWTGRAQDLWIGASILVLTLFAVEVSRHTFGVLMPWSFYGAQLAALGRLLWLLPEALWNPGALTLDHDWSWITRPIAALALVAAPLLLAVAIRASRMWAFALGWSVIALAPRLLVPMPDGLHERHLYIPLVAWSVAIGATLFPKRTV